VSAAVLDASVLIKLYVQEDDSRRAVAAVKKAGTLLAPDLVWSEAANILWKYVRRGELEAADASTMLDDMLRMPIEITPSGDLVTQAFEIATQTGRTVYDSLYLALAVQTEAVFLTADARLVNALAGGPLAKFVRGL
jgi:predicted nucleic acid-binding protein